MNQEPDDIQKAGEEKAQEIFRQEWRRKLRLFMEERARIRKELFERKKKLRTISNKSRNINRLKARLKKGWKQKKYAAVTRPS